MEDGRAYAAVVMDAAAPRLEVYEQPLRAQVRFTVINAVPGGEMLVTLQGASGGGMAASSLAFGASTDMDVGPQRTLVSVTPPGSPAPILLAGLDDTSDTFFLVIAPGVEPGQDYALIQL